MCRWLAYSGSPVRIEDLLYRPAHSLIDQSLHSKLGAETTNGDGFGVGWYGVGDSPGLFRSVEPAWNDRNLRRPLGPRRIAARLRPHPRLDGVADPADELPSVPPRQLALDAQRDDPRLPRRSSATSCSRSTRRSTRRSKARPTRRCSSSSRSRSGSPTTRRAAVEAAVGLIEAVGARHGIDFPIQMTVATTDGIRTWGFRYSSEHESRTLFYSTDVPTLRALYPELEVLRTLSDTSRLIVSEPIRDLPGAWNEVPESSYGIVHGSGHDEPQPFTPRRRHARSASPAPAERRAPGQPVVAGSPLLPGAGSIPA